MATIDPVFSSETIQPLARESGRQLAAFIKGTLAVQIEGTQTRVTLPAVAVRLLVDVLAQLAQGHAVNITPFYAEFTTQQAADFLGVSRPHLVKLLETGEIPFHKVGTHRRVLFEQLLGYRNEKRQKRLVALEQLAADAQEHGDGY